jgi:carboxyl-terminal processing protease
MMRRLGIAALLGTTVLVIACGMILGPDPATNRAALFDEFWNEFDRHYAMFELKDIDWNGVRDVYRPQAIAATTDDAFVTVLGRMIDTLDDVHVSFTVGNIRQQSGDSATARRTYFAEATVFSNFVPSTQFTPSKHMRYGLYGGVGYVRIASFGGEDWGHEIDIVLRAIGNAPGLIIDIRDNGGGNDSNGRDIAARFTTERRAFSYVKYRSGPAHSDFTPLFVGEIEPAGVHFGGRVVLLTNRLDFSAAEHFALMIRAIPGAVIVGDTTGGASGNPLKRELSNGWIYQLSESITYALNKQTFEEVGIAPDIVVKQTEADLNLSSDPPLFKAAEIANTPLTRASALRLPSQ